MASRREAPPPLPTDSTTENRHEPADHRESHHAVHRHQRPLLRPRGRTPPAPGRVIVQCVDDIDEMQRWLERRE